MLLILKLTITPVLVALMSLAARRWGPTIGGLIMGLPWMTGPILFFLGLEHGDAYVARAAIGVLVGAIAIGAHIIIYVYVARSAGWPASLAAAFVAFAATGYALSGLDLSLWSAAGGAAISLTAAFLAMPRVSDPGTLRFVPWWDIPMRMAATATLVGIITLLAGLLGPERIGVVSTYPVILSVIGAFTHAQWGWPATVQLARGVSLSLLSFVVFFLMLGLFAERIGLTWSFALASGAALAISAVMMLVNGIRRGRSAGASKAS